MYMKSEITNDPDKALCGCSKKIVSVKVLSEEHFDGRVSKTTYQCKNCKRIIEFYDKTVQIKVYDSKRNFIRKIENDPTELPC